MNSLQPFIRPLLSIVCCVVLVVGTEHANAEDDELLLVMEYVSTQATAENAIAARAKAIEQARTVAFHSLMQHFNVEVGHAVNRIIASEQINSLVHGFEVRDEKIGTNSYQADIQYVFEKQAINDLLEKYGLIRTDVTASTQSTKRAADIVVIPHELEGESLLNDWYSAWNRATIPSISVLPFPKYNDLVRSKLNVEHAPLNEGVLASIWYHFNDKPVVCAAQLKDASLHLKVKLICLVQQQLIHHDVLINKNDAVPDNELYQQGVLKVATLLNQYKSQQNSSTQSAIDHTPSTMVLVTYNSIAEWLELKKNLSKLAGAKLHMVMNMTSRQAIIRLSDWSDDDMKVLLNTIPATIVADDEAEVQLETSS